MNNHQRLLACVLALAASPAAWSVSSKEMSEAQMRFKEERAQCLSGQSHQDRATCLKEATAALQEARRGGLENTSGNTYQQNTIARCGAQPDADRDMCVQRMQGKGTVQGSVKGGGLIREFETKGR